MHRSFLCIFTALVAFPALAPAAVIYSGLQNIPIPTNLTGIYLNVDTGATASSTFTGWDVNFFFGGAGIANSLLFQPARTGSNNLDAIVRFDAGQFINGSLTYSTGSGGSGDPNNHLGAGSNQFQVGTPAYLGFRFTTDASSGPYFGWMQVVLTNDTPGGMIVDWAYEDTGAPIVAGAPEPGRGLLLVAGLMTLGLRRRRGRSRLQ
jgi:hypothetical protein